MSRGRPDLYPGEPNPERSPYWRQGNWPLPDVAAPVIWPQLPQQPEGDIPQARCAPGGVTCSAPADAHQPSESSVSDTATLSIRQPKSSRESLHQMQWQA